MEEIRENLKQGEIPLVEETQVPCRVLRISSEVAMVSRSAWEGLCKRRTSWYWTSEMAEKTLVVSNEPLELSDLWAQIVITESSFKPDRLPDSAEMTRMVKSNVFRKRVPQLWETVEPIERDFYQRWLKRYRVNEPFDFDRIFLIHSANHANFLDPLFFVTLDDRSVPYSIADSLHTCSSCLEFFSILGEQWPLKYVVPCLGAVQFAHLPRDQYFEIVTTQGPGPGR